MTDFLSIEILGDRNLIRNLDQMPDTVRAILVDKVEVWTNKAREAVEANILQRFSQKTGRLLEGVDSEVTQEGPRVEGRVFVSGVPYARAQESGGSTPPHMIYPRDNNKVLAFIGATGDKVFATRVFHPGGQIMGKYYMKDAYRELSPQIGKGVKKAVVEGIRQKMRRT